MEEGVEVEDVEVEGVVVKDMVVNEVPVDQGVVNAEDEVEGEDMEDTKLQTDKYVID